MREDREERVQQSYGDERDCDEDGKWNVSVSSRSHRTVRHGYEEDEEDSDEANHVEDDASLAGCGQVVRAIGR